MCKSSMTYGLGSGSKDQSLTNVIYLSDVKKITTKTYYYFIRIKKY